MTHRGWLLGVLVLLVSASFAGCLGGDDDDPAPADNKDGAGDGGNRTADPSDGSGGDGDTGNGNATGFAPVAAIAVVVNLTAAPDEILTFDASGTVDNDTAPENLTFAWDFGDGNTAEGINATHAFTSEGNYTVNLTVTDPEGNTGSANTTIVVANAFEDTIVAELTGTIVAPNPIVHNIGPAYGTAGAACGTFLECYTTFGGVEDTHFVLHALEIPAGAAAVTLDAPDIGPTATLQFAVFDAAGGRIATAPVGTGTNPQATTLNDPAQFAGGITVFVSSPISASVAYTITVTALAEAP